MLPSQDDDAIYAEPSPWGDSYSAFKEWCQEIHIQLRPWASTIQEVEGRHGAPPDPDGRSAPVVNLSSFIIYGLAA